MEVDEIPGDHLSLLTGEGVRPESPALVQAPATSAPARRMLNPTLSLFLVTMVLANVAGHMYGPLLPLYLKSGSSIRRTNSGRQRMQPSRCSIAPKDR